MINKSTPITTTKFKAATEKYEESRRAEYKSLDVAESKTIHVEAVEQLLVEESSQCPHTSDMTTPISREELDAKLGQNLAEVRAVASEIKQASQEQLAGVAARFDEGMSRLDDRMSRTDERMASFELFMREQAARSEAAITALSAKVDASEKSLSANLESVKAKVDGVEKGIEGKIDGLKSHIEGLKSSISMAQWVVGIVFAVAGIWVGYMQLKQAESTPSPAPTVIVVPSQAPTQAVPQKK
ncbi:hypothetical protein [Aquitalea aquatilis]|uniref:hypothetical protein n=1 Tax=Aquitalea aquatilis TaxID=1537400 RepID=UPI0010BDA32E|nr:hypothetical protein [Aquitalea aquatilis]